MTPLIIRVTKVSEKFCLHSLVQNSFVDLFATSGCTRTVVRFRALARYFNVSGRATCLLDKRIWDKRIVFGEVGSC